MKTCLVALGFGYALALSAFLVWQNVQAQNTSLRPATETAVATPGVLVATTKDSENPPPFVTDIPAGYRDWKLISVARKEGTLDDIRAILGNDIAIKAYREGKQPFPEGSIIARLAWSYVASEENNKAFGKPQSFVAGDPKNGVQFMIKDSAKYAATGGWGYGQFENENGKSVNVTALLSCFPCHQAIQSRDYVFSRYAR
jgi:hypothetical protein